MTDLDNPNANQSGSSPVQTLPAGQYVAMITEAELKPYKVSPRDYLLLTFQIIEGPYAGRFLWKQLNLNHPHPTIRSLASEELSSICRAVGLSTLQDYTELYNRPLMIDACCQTHLDDGTVTNRIVGYWKK